MLKIGILKVQRTTAIHPGEYTDPVYVVAETIDTNLYNDITSISSWYDNGIYLGKDYKFLRKRIQELTPDDNDSQSWISLSEHEKWIICSTKSTSLERIRNYFGNSMDSYMQNFDVQSRSCRETRFTRAKSIVLNNVERLDAFQILQVIEQDKLMDRYIQQGIEGTVDGDPIEGLFNFIESTPLSYYGGQTIDPFGNNLGKYENTGILTRTLNFQNNAQINNNLDLKNALIECLRNGNY